MIRIFGIRTLSLPSFEEMRTALPVQWVDAWRERHARMQSADRQKESLGALWLLFQAGGRGSLCYTALGRPYFFEKTAEFSLTHTEHFLFCALDDESISYIGIDAEATGRLSAERMNSLAARWFAPEEQKYYQKSPDLSTFLRLWTRKEASVKRSGEGLRALRETDTVKEEQNGTQFVTFTIEDTVVTLCASKQATVSDQIELLRSP